MKNCYYLLLLCIGFFNVNTAIAQSCPPTGFSNGSSLYFFYDVGTSNCVDRPSVIIVGSSEFTSAYCDVSYSRYDLSSGSPLANPNMFTADFGYGTCEYTNGTLTNESLSIEQVEAIFNSLSIYPNPLTSGNTLNIKFGANVSASLNLYDITGKMVLSSATEGLATKPLALSNLPNGIYLLQIASDNLSISRKVVIMR